MGKYKFTHIPAHDEGEYQCVVEYQEKDELSLYGTTEPNLILSFISLLLKTDARFLKSDVYGQVPQGHAPLQRPLPPALTAAIKVVDDFTSYLNKLENLDDKIFDRFLRSCSMYQKGLRFIKEDPILSFFLFVSAIETLSNTVIAGNEGKEAKYKKFIYEYSPDEIRKEQNEEFDELLEQAYKIRSKFTHFGTNYESPIGVADLLHLARKLRYFRDYSESPPVKVPSVYWFENVVHRILLEFLERQQDKHTDGVKVAKHALKLSTVTTKAARAIQVGEPVTLDDIRPE